MEIITKLSSCPWLMISFTFFLILLNFSIITNAETSGARISLIKFLQTLDSNSNNAVQSLRWNADVDPCNGDASKSKWSKVSCNSKNQVKKLLLDNLNLAGKINASLLCAATGINVVRLRWNKLTGTLTSEISKCAGMKSLLVRGNKLSGKLPDELGQLKNLKSLDISFNNFSGWIPASLADISGLNTFLAQNNSLSGGIPQFDFTNMDNFDVAYNQLSGPIPDGGDRAGAAAFAGNSGLCGKIINVTCPERNTKKKKKRFRISGEKLAMISGYILLGFTMILLIVFKFMFSKKEKKTDDRDSIGSSYEEKKVVQSSSKTPDEAELSAPVAASSTSLVILGAAPAIAKDQLKFDELMRAPAELMGRGRFGSSYKVVVGEANHALVVKRIKSSFWGISPSEFRSRMERLETLRHRNVLPPVAFYVSEQEKLVVYEFQQNGNLFMLLHGGGCNFDWPHRLRAAAGIAAGLNFMHQQLEGSNIAHGNLKSTNVLIYTTMDPLITEYGLIPATATVSPPTPDVFAGDVYGYGVILLELLTGKLLAQNNEGKELVKWVKSVVREEWTAEVFDGKLVAGGSASEEGMVRLLRLAMRCVDPSPENRPRMSKVEAEISAIVREEEELDRSMASDA